MTSLQHRVRLVFAIARAMRQFPVTQLRSSGDQLSRVKITSVMHRCLRCTRGRIAIGRCLLMSFLSQKSIDTSLFDLQRTAPIYSEVTISRRGARDIRVVLFNNRIVVLLVETTSYQRIVRIGFLFSKALCVRQRRRAVVGAVSRADD
jgi:hypothetical protein